MRGAAGLRNVAVHNSRQAVYDSDLQVLDKPDFIQHPELRKHNEGERMKPEAVLKRRNDRIKEANLIRKPKKDASTAIEVIVTASPEWFTDRSPKEIKDFFANARKALTDRFGAENLLMWNTHWDEKTPHLHILFVPIVQTEKGNKYSADAVMGNRKQLAEFQDYMIGRLGKQYGLERGIQGSKARHKDQYDRARDLEKLEKALKQERDVLKQERDVLERRKKLLEDREAEFNIWRKELAARWNALSDVEKAKVERQYKRDRGYER